MRTLEVTISYCIWRIFTVNIISFECRNRNRPNPDFWALICYNTIKIISRTPRDVINQYIITSRIFQCNPVPRNSSSRRARQSRMNGDTPFSIEVGTAENSLCAWITRLLIAHLQERAGDFQEASHAIPDDGKIFSASNVGSRMDSY